MSAKVRIVLPVTFMVYIFSVALNGCSGFPIHAESTRGDSPFQFIFYNYGVGPGCNSCPYKEHRDAIDDTTRKPTTPGMTTPGRTTPGMTTPGRTTPGMTTPGRTTPGPTTSGPTTPGPTTSGPTTPGPTTPGPTTSRQTTPGHTTPRQTTAGPTVG